MGNLLRNKWLVAILALVALVAVGAYLLLMPDSAEKKKPIVVERAKMAQAEKKSTDESSAPKANLAPGETAPKREVVGTVAQFKGLAFANFESVKRSLAEGSPLYQGDLIVTGREARLILKMRDDAVIALGPDSEFQIQEYQFAPKESSGNGVVHMSKGMVRFTSGKLAQLKNQPFKVTTPVATLGVRGTEGFARLGDGKGKEREIEVITLKKEVLVWMEDAARPAPASAPNASAGWIHYSWAWSLVSAAHAADTSKEPFNVQQKERLSGSPNKAPEIRKATREELMGAHASTAVRKLSKNALKKLQESAAKSLVEKGTAADLASAMKLLEKNPAALKELVDQAEEKLQKSLEKEIEKQLDQEEKREKQDAKLKEELGEEAFAKFKAAEELRASKSDALEQEKEQKLQELLGDEALVEAAREIESDQEAKKAELIAKMAEEIAKAEAANDAKKVAALKAEQEKKLAALEKETAQALKKQLGAEKAEQVSQINGDIATRQAETEAAYRQQVEAAVPSEKQGLVNGLNAERQSLVTTLNPLALSRVSELLQDTILKENQSALNDFVATIAQEIAAGSTLEQALQKRHEAAVEQMRQEAQRLGVDYDQAEQAAEALRQADEAARSRPESATPSGESTAPSEEGKSAGTPKTDEKSTGEGESAADAKKSEGEAGKTTASGTPAPGVSTTTTTIPGLSPTPVDPTATQPLSSSGGGGGSNTTTTTITVNQFPSIDAYNFTIDENAAVGTVVGTLSASDADVVDQSRLTFSLSGSTAFTVNSKSGVITVIDSTALDYETAPTLTLTATVKDSRLASASNSVVIRLKNLNEAPVVTSAASAGSFAENGTGTVYTATATDQDVDDTRTWSLSGADAALFAINADSGAVTFVQSPNHESPTDSGGDNIYNFSVVATDAAGLSGSKAVTLVVSDLNETPGITSGSAASFEENGTGTVYTATASDPDATESLVWSLSGSDAALFAIDAASGAITFLAPPNFEAPADQGADNSYDLQLTVTDKGGLTASKNIAITVTGSNEAPAVGSGSTTTFAENGAGTAYAATASDPDANDTQSWSLSGSDADRLTIDPASGAVSFRQAPDYESPADSGGDRVYEFVVTVTDSGGLTASRNVAITVTDVNEAPSVNSGGAASFAENGSGTVYAATASDPDANESHSWSISGSDAALFAIDAASGAVTFVQSPDFEIPGDLGADNTYDLDVTVTDQGGLSATRSVAITVTDVNEAPTVTSGGVVQFAENGTGTLQVATASDPDANDTRSWSLSGVDAARFAIDASSGAVTFLQAPDFEIPTDDGADNVYDLQLTVTDSGGLTASQPLSVTVTGVNEAPTVTSTSAVTVSENVTGSIHTATASDPDADDTRSWSLSGSDAALFAIDASSGAIAFLNSPNFESPADAGADNRYELQLTVTDSGGLTATQSLAVVVSDLNESPSVTSGETVTVAENVSGTIHTATASDPDAGTTLLWSLSGSDAARFVIDAASGAVSFVQSPDFESPADSGADNLYEIQLIVTDQGGLTATRSLSVTVTDRNESPSVTSASSLSFAENGTGTVLTATASDPDANDTRSWSLSGSDAALFAIDAASGAITFLQAPDFESPADSGADNLYDLQVTVTDAGGLTASGSVAITVTGVNESPAVTSGSAATFAENGTGTVYTATASDPDANDTRSWSLSGSDAGRFVIDPASGAVTFATAPDFETPTDSGADNGYDLQVIVTDQGGLSASQGVVITVTDVNESPLAVDDSATAVEAGGTGNATAGSAASGNLVTNDRDPESDTLTVTAIRSGSVEGGGTEGTVGAALSGSYGTLTVTASGDFSYVVNQSLATVEALKSGQSLVESFNYTLTAGSLSDTALLTITIQGANDAPVAADDARIVVKSGSTTDPGSGSGNVVSNDTDIEGDSLTVSAIRLGSSEGSGTAGSVGVALSGTYGTLTLSADGSYLYTVREDNSAVSSLLSGQTLLDTFNYTVSDSGLSDTGVLTVAIQGSGSAGSPVAVDDTGTAIEAGGTANGTAGAAASGTLLGNDIDLDSTSLTVESIRLGSVEGSGTAGTVGTGLAGLYGTLTVSASGGYTYVVNDSLAAVEALKSGQSLTDSFNYTVSDGALSDTGLLTITIQGANDAPVVGDDSVNATKAGNGTGVSPGSASGSVLSNDSDVEGDTLTVTAIRSGATEGSGTAGTPGTALSGSYGSLNLAADGSFVYTIDESSTAVQALGSGQSLSDSFNYTASDGTLTDTGVVTVTIRGANSAPVAADDSANALEAGGTGNGTAGSAASGNLLTNDTDSDSSSLTVTAIRLGSVEGSGTAGAVGSAVSGLYGTLTVSAQGAYSYVVNDSASTVQALQSGQSLTESFNYAVSDEVSSDQAVLTITIQGANDAPTVTSSATLSVAESTTGTIQTATASDPEGDSLVWSLSGTDADLFSIDASTGALSFLVAPDYENPTDSGADNIYDVTVVATDNGSPVLSGTQALTVTVTNVNDAPTITAPASVTASEDTAVTMAFAVADVDAGSNTLQATLSVANGTLTLTSGSGVTITSGADGTAGITFTGTLTQINAALGSLSYQGSADYAGSEILTLVINDQGNSGSGGAQSASATVPFTVEAVNDAPVVTAPASATVSEDSPTAITGFAVTDVDAASGTLQATL
ncbi:MAG: cadherin domain-containing protein, partial [Magnetococcales bacterium]|nr:cadherin domain-containing protein [Magnetococcales bacterium]